MNYKQALELGIKDQDRLRTQNCVKKTKNNKRTLYELAVTRHASYFNNLKIQKKIKMGKVPPADTQMIDSNALVHVEQTSLQIDHEVAPDIGWQIGFEHAILQLKSHRFSFCSKTPNRHLLIYCSSLWKNSLMASV